MYIGVVVLATPVGNTGTGGGGVVDGMTMMLEGGVLRTEESDVTNEEEASVDDSAGVDDASGVEEGAGVLDAELDDKIGPQTLF